MTALIVGGLVLFVLVAIGLIFSIAGPSAAYLAKNAVQNNWELYQEQPRLLFRHKKETSWPHLWIDPGSKLIKPLGWEPAPDAVVSFLDFKEASDFFGANDTANESGYTFFEQHKNVFAWVENPESFSGRTPNAIALENGKFRSMLPKGNKRVFDTFDDALSFRLMSKLMPGLDGFFGKRPE